MLGIIVWAILIIIIGECACPGIIWVTLGTMAGFVALYFAILAIVEAVSKLKKRK